MNSKYLCPFCIDDSSCTGPHILEKDLASFNFYITQEIVTAKANLDISEKENENMTIAYYEGYNKGYSDGYSDGRSFNGYEK